MLRHACFVILALGTAPAVAAQSGSTNAKPAVNRPSARTVWPDETGPLKWAPRPTVPAITANDLRTRLYQLADDSMQGRRVGEPGNYKATDYIAREFRRLGLKPAGENGSYFQELPFGPRGFDSLAVRLVAGATPLAFGRDWMPDAPTAANSVAASAALQGVPTVFAGRWGDSTVTLDPAFRGKVAVFIAPPGNVGRGAGRGAGPQNRCQVQGLGGAAPAIAAAAAAAARGRGGAGGRGGNPADSRPASIGVAGILLVQDFSAAAATAAATMRQGMQVVPAPGAIPAATITTAVAAAMFGKPVSDLAVGALGQPVTANWTYDWHKSPTPARNVIAVLPGSSPALASEYVLVGAHNDHNGVNAVAVDHDSLRAFNRVVRPEGANDPSCVPTPEQQHAIDSLIARARSIRPPRRDSIMNGADDDGSGTVVLLELAERFATEHPARSIIFISHVGEEAGLLGSAWFTEHPTIPLDAIAAALNMDMVGKGRVTDVPFGGPNSVQTLGSRRLSRAFGDIIDSVNAISPEPMAIDRSWDVPANPLNRFCRSDQVNYVRHNVPVTYFSLGYAQDYHQPTDEPQYIDYDHAARLGRWIHDIMTAIANRKDRPHIDAPDPSYPACR